MSTLTTGTDRGSPPYGNTLNKVSVASSFAAEAKPAIASADLVVVDGLHEPIGLVGRFDKGKMYIAELGLELGGCIWEIELGSGEKRPLVTKTGRLTGIALAS